MNEEKLAALRKEYAEQDNRCTAYPIFVSVQELHCVGPMKEGYGASCPYGDDQTKTVYRFEDFEGEYQTKEEIIKFLKEDGREDEAHKIEEFQLGYIWHSIQFFLTIKGAEAYIKANKHNHGELRTYVHYIALRNYEMRELLENIDFKTK